MIWHMRVLVLAVLLVGCSQAAPPPTPERVAQALQRAGIPAEVSQTAGTYVCNHVFYGLMHALRGKRAVRGGFVHIPYAPEQAARHAGAASLPTAVVVEALRIIVRTTLKHPDDLAIGIDATH